MKVVDTCGYIYTLILYTNANLHIVTVETLWTEYSNQSTKYPSHHSGIKNFDHDSHEYEW